MPFGLKGAGGPSFVQFAPPSEETMIWLPANPASCLPGSSMGLLLMAFETAVQVLPWSVLLSSPPP